jgi:hypothetical protein
LEIAGWTRTVATDAEEDHGIVPVRSYHRSHGATGQRGEEEAADGEAAKRPNPDEWDFARHARPSLTHHEPHDGPRLIATSFNRNLS